MKITKKLVFVFTCFPPKGTLTLTPGMGGGGGTIWDPKTPPNPKNSQKNSSYENCSHFSDIFKYKKIFKICSYIQKRTPNPINAVRITIYSTKHTKDSKIYFGNPKQNIEKINRKIHRANKNRKIVNLKIISNFHNSYFVFFVYFVYFVSSPP